MRCLWNFSSDHIESVSELVIGLHDSTPISYLNQKAFSSKNFFFFLKGHQELIGICVLVLLKVEHFTDSRFILVF